jgi:hypothetical protein
MAEDWASQVGRWVMGDGRWVKSEGLLPIPHSPFLIAQRSIGKTGMPDMAGQNPSESGQNPSGPKSTRAQSKRP